MPSLVKYSMGKLSRLSKNRESFPPRLFCRIRYDVLLYLKSNDLSILDPFKHQIYMLATHSPSKRRGITNHLLLLIQLVA